MNSGLAALGEQGSMWMGRAKKAFWRRYEWSGVSKDPAASLGDLETGASGAMRILCWSGPRGLWGEPRAPGQTMYFLSGSVGASDGSGIWSAFGGT